MVLGWRFDVCVATVGLGGATMALREVVLRAGADVGRNRGGVEGGRQTPLLAVDGDASVHGDGNKARTRTR